MKRKLMVMFIFSIFAYLVIIGTILWYNRKQIGILPIGASQKVKQPVFNTKQKILPYKARKINAANINEEEAEKEPLSTGELLQ